MCGLAASLAFVIIHYLAVSADSRRIDEVRLAEVQADFYLLRTKLERPDEKDNTRNFDAVAGRVRSLVHRLKTDGHGHNVLDLESSFASFLRVSRVQLEAFEREQHSSKRRLDDGATVVEFQRMERAAKRLKEDVSREAAGWTAYASVATGVGLLLGASLVMVLVSGYQRRTLTLLAVRSRQQALATSERRFRALVQNSADVIAVTDEEGVFTLVSDACRAVWGLSPERYVGRSIHSIVHPDDASRFRQFFERAKGVREGQNAIEIRVLGPSGGDRCFQIQFTDLIEDPDITGILLTFHDLTERIRFEEELTHHAFHDRLTGMPNRSLFMDRLSHRLRASAAEHQPVAVLFIDLDNFKVINDSLGHEAGDRLLIGVAERFYAALRPADTVARLGGDEFVILLDGATQIDDAIRVARRIIGTFEHPVHLGDREVFATGSIGIAMSNESLSDAHGLLRDADTAMYQAKAQGKCRFAVFDRSMNRQAMERLEIESDLRNASENGQLQLKYQPIVSIASGRLCEVEVLVRWQHPNRGELEPITFIPIAEETGLICPIGYWVLRESCSQLRQWQIHFRNYRDLGLSVNVSGRQLYEVDFVRNVKGILSEYGIDPHRLKLEITESAMLNDLERMTEVLQDLRSVGIRIAIDDFGTGYSSMAYPSRLPVDTLKIDRSFVGPLGRDSKVDGVVHAMITMARTLGLDVTSEGIETPEQLEVLRKLGCDSGQGFLFSVPLSVLGVTRLLSAPREEPVAPHIVPPSSAASKW
jgi:diguanylate cyclase (GGDEF)-like protein/PAS domain S-box-containing protein